MALLHPSSGLDPQAGAEYWTDRVKAPLAELVDAPHSKCGSERSSGSSPEGGTITSLNALQRKGFWVSGVY